MPTRSAPPAQLARAYVTVPVGSRGLPRVHVSRPRRFENSQVKSRHPSHQHGTASSPRSTHAVTGAKRIRCVSLWSEEKGTSRQLERGSWTAGALSGCR